MNDNNKYGAVPKAFHELYIDYLANPLDTRSDAQFCADNNLEPATLRAWVNKYRPAIYEEANKRAKHFNNQVRLHAKKSLSKKVEKLDTNALKLLFQLMGDLVEKVDTRVEHMNESDVKRRLNALLENISGKTKAWEGVPNLQPEQETPKKDDHQRDGEHGPKPGENPNGSGQL